MNTRRPTHPASRIPTGTATRASCTAIRTIPTYTIGTATARRTEFAVRRRGAKLPKKSRRKQP